MLQELSRILEVSVDELLAGKEEEKQITEKNQPGEEEKAGRGKPVLSVRLILSGIFFLPMVLVICMQALYLYVRRSSQFEYIIGWLPYLFFGIAVLSAAFGVCILLKNKRLRLFCGTVSGLILLILLVLGIHTTLKPDAKRVCSVCLRTGT